MASFDAWTRLYPEERRSHYLKKDPSTAFIWLGKLESLQMKQKDDKYSRITTKRREISGFWTKSDSIDHNYRRTIFQKDEAQVGEIKQQLDTGGDVDYPTR